MLTGDPAAFDLDAWMNGRRVELEQALARVLPPSRPPEADPGRLGEAMRYAVLGGGKRLRPLLTLAAWQACCVEGAQSDTARPALDAACAIELVHCYSLVHDDLPAMDDDDVRRGRPTLHRAFDEATAVLTGDALLTLAFELLAEVCPHAVRVMARRAGWEGMIDGQARDLELRQSTASIEALETLHRSKTGALFAAAAELGLVAATPCRKPPHSAQHSAPHGADLPGYGLALGIAFQHVDDLDDADHAEHAAIARVRVRTLLEEAERRVTPLSDAATPLVAIARRIGGRFSP
jgi:geranylgeranyl pyrophosphate synthase